MRTEAMGSVVQAVASWNPRAAANRPITYLDLSSVDNRTKLIVEPTIVDSSEAPSRARQLVSTGDVLVSTVRPNLNAVAWVPPEFDGATASTGFCVLRPRKEDLDGRYLFHWVRTRAFVSEMVRLATGASYPAVSDKIVHGSTIPLPSIEEQRRIASILDAADALRAKRRQALEKLDSLTQSIFIDMFGDPLANPRGWEVAPLSEIANKFSDGPFGSNLKSEHYVASGVRVVRLQNIGVGHFVDEDQAFISPEHFKTLERHACQPGDVLVGTMGDPNLRACIQPDWLPLAINKADCVQIRVDPERATARWLSGLLNCPATEELAQSIVRGQTRARISMGRLRELRVPIPPLPLQLTFASRVRSASALEERYRGAADSTDSLFASLQLRAFRGEL